VKFTYESYYQLLKLLDEYHYHICDYADYANYEKAAILRHDVDTSIDKAVELAGIENTYGVHGTYFILLGTDFYNVNSRQSLEKIKVLQKLGGKIGLHFDETKYEIKSSEKMVECILKEKAELESSIESPIHAVSMHRPSKWILEKDIVVPGMINSYSQQFFKTFKYVSDSRRHWREDIRAIICSEEYKYLHILTHAFWYNKEEKSARECILECIKMASKERYLSFFDNIRDLDEFVQEGDLTNL